MDAMTEGDRTIMNMHVLPGHFLAELILQIGRGSYRVKLSRENITYLVNKLEKAREIMDENAQSHSHRQHERNNRV